MIRPTDLITPVTDDDITWVSQLMGLRPLDRSRREFLSILATRDVSACPGSGKTTIVVAKLAILARKWTSSTQGICVLSHTNVAREEIEHRLGGSVVGKQLLAYPHFIDTIHGFVSRFLAIPWLLSAGYKISAIDDDLTTGVRRRFLGEKDYARLNFYLEKKNRSFADLRLGSAHFQTPIADGAFPDGPHTPMYQLAASALRHAAEEGYFCYDEIFVLGEALLAQQPTLPAILQQRFPFVFVDEMQDTTEQQNLFLSRLFPRDAVSVCIQRIGDPNQAIFERGIKPVADAFPDPQQCIGIADSFRLPTSIATLASPFAYVPVEPDGLIGIGGIGAPGGALPHTIFVFPDDDASMVLSAFGHHVLTTLADSTITGAAVRAVGSVHKAFDDIPPGHKHYPKTVHHYWADYQPKGNHLRHRPQTLIEYIRLAQDAAKAGAALSECVNSVAFGIGQLANLMVGATKIAARARQHLHTEQLLQSSPVALSTYRGVITRFLIDQETLTGPGWTGLSEDLKVLGLTLGGGDKAPKAADAFLAWQGVVVTPPPGDHVQPPEAIPPNCYRYSDNGRSVDILLSSIHVAKGQTHLATLILETFNRAHVLDSLMPWLLGKHSNGKKCANDTAAQRLMQIYVAMTRPTHLLCLAVRNSSLGVGATNEANRETLRLRGWRVQIL
ncbi:UvrD-helicase domain-containing protein [Cupriavidus sp. UME77]|uniref:UvrD-helicase domain-containing protein n=1 Tax=Cupriavidus sp. UME77 TaxID=1862321 RepID=UPI0016033E0C|nr:UvrD-helicase domain-containing protein [Cupriavidus sp. UME77]MBB1632464.1 hypothetical protein [Cupriavidus sp. UME77]